MLPKKNRLTKKKDFARVFDGGKSVKIDLVIVKFLENGLPDSRFGFVISKKISPKATIRNKVRRRLRDSVAPLVAHIKTPADFIFITLPGIQKKEFAELVAAVQKIISKIQ